MQAMGPYGEERSEVAESAEALAVLAAGGDDGALSTLVHRYSRPLYSFIRRYHPDGGDCDDLFQETWMGVMSGIGRFDPTRRFSTWLFQIALNKCRDLARRGRTRTKFQAEQMDQNKEMIGESVEKGIESAAVTEAIEALPTLQKEVLLLRYYNDLSEAEVSEILGCPRGTVKSRLHNALKAVRQTLTLGEAGS